MRSFLLVVVLLGTCIVAASCRSQPQPPKSELRLTATIKDIMDSIVDPSADYLWDSVATIVSAQGMLEKAPKTPEDWNQARRRAIALLEATNLLIMEGRQVAQPHEKSLNPGIELQPEDIKARIDKDRTTWISRAHSLHDAVMPALKAIDEKNVQGLLDAGAVIDEACENCHLTYWYPDEKGPPPLPEDAPAPTAAPATTGKK